MDITPTKVALGTGGVGVTAAVLGVVEAMKVYQDMIEGKETLKAAAIQKATEAGALDTALQTCQALNETLSDKLVEVFRICGGG